MKKILLFVLLVIFNTKLNAQNTIIVKFNYAYLDFDVIDNYSIKKISLQKIFNSNSSKELETLFSNFPELKQCNVEKIFPNITSKDTISISRLGEKVTIPPFWATFRLHVPSNFSTERIIQFLDNFQPLIEYAHFDFPAFLQSTPNDTLYNKQISLNGSSLHPNAGINIEEAWNIEKGKSFIKVGVHDSGIDSLHPDLDVVFGGAYYEENLPNLPLSWGTGGPHGTGVAGIIGAKRNNTIGIAGIAGGDNTQGSGISLIDLKVDFLNQNNVASHICASVVDAARSVGSYWDYPEGYYSDQNSYFDKAKGFGIHIGNHSYIIKTNNSIPNETESNEVEKDLENPSVSNPTCVLCREAYLFSLKNCVINVVARGNSKNILPNTDPTSINFLYPQSFPDNWIISVGASGYDGFTVQNGLNQSVSESFQGFWSLYGSNMDIIAPGSDSIVYTTNVVFSVPQTNPYRTFNGTSAAAPHVSGVAALLLSHYNQDCYSQSNLAVEDVEYILEKSATNLYGAGYDDTTGWGRLNAYKALQMIENPTKQIVHPDSLISTTIISRDTISLSYKNAFVPDNWGPISSAMPLESNKFYQVERVLVENQYSFAEYMLPSTNLIDVWVRPSASNSIRFYDDTNTVWAGPAIGYQYNFDNFDMTPFEELNFVDSNLYIVKTRGYYYHFIGRYIDDESFILDITYPTDVWLPSDPNVSPKLPFSIYIHDSTLISNFDFPCDSLNPLFDDDFNLGDNELDENHDEITLYPNPSNGSFTLLRSSGQKIERVEIFDLNGKLIFYSEPISNKEIIDMSKNQKGVYFVKCNNQNSIKLIKFIKI